MGKGKKILYITLAICGAAVIGFTLFGILSFSRTKLTFPSDGYVFGGTDYGEAKQLPFTAQTEYMQTKDGKIKFRTADGEKVTAAGDSFIRFNDGSTSAFSDGIVLDFNDLSENFINNYYMPEGIVETYVNGEYVTNTETGTKFGEHLWKVEENKYLIQSPANKIHFSENDVRDVGDYVQVTINEDRVCQLLTSENRWSSINEDLYIETQNGVRIYPLAQIIENDDYKLSMAKITVSPDDAIVLSKAEQRRQIVPELNFEAVDGADGDAGTSGSEGTSGINGVDGQAGAAGADGASGEDGGDGNSGSAAANGASAYEVWLSEDGNAGKSEAEFRNDIKGNSAYEVWVEEQIELHPETKKEDYNEDMFKASINGATGSDGKTAMELWLEKNPGKTETDYLNERQGDTGKSGLQAWLDANPEMTEDDYKKALKGGDGGDGTDGKTAMQRWMEETGGTEEEYLATLQGEDGKSGFDIWKEEQMEHGVPEEECTMEKYLETLQGDNGQSALEAWLAANPGKTEADYLESLKGESGSPGTKGDDGSDADQSSTSKTALPVMTFGLPFDITATRVQGTIQISDEGGMLKGIDPQANPKYAGKVRIYNEATGEVFDCTECKTNEFIVDQYSKQSFEGFNVEGAKEVYFSSDYNDSGSIKHVLEPNTPYRISVTAYYKDEASSKIYAREFLSRTFYTDSTGIILSEGEAGVDELSLNYSVSGDYLENMKTAEIYLLTPETAETFSRANKDQNFEYKVLFDYTNGAYHVYRNNDTETDVKSILPASVSEALESHAKKQTTDAELLFMELHPNTDYVVKGVVNYSESGTVIETLMDQSMELTTLKRSPSWDEDIKPSMSYNRVTGGFDVYRPNIVDPDNGVVQYKYTIYKKASGSDSKYDLFKEGTLSASDAEPATFFLDTNGGFGTEAYMYKVNVEMEFYDNEKTVFYDLGDSPIAFTEGTYLPKISLINVGQKFVPATISEEGIYKSYTAEDGSVIKIKKYEASQEGKYETEEVGAEMNKMTGTIRIDLGTVRTMKPIGPDLGSTGTDNSTYPIDIDIYAESYNDVTNKPYYTERIRFEGGSTEAYYEDIEPGTIYKISRGYLHEAAGTENQFMDIDLELYYLRANTDYTITLKGWLDLTGTGNNYSYQTIGQVRFRTTVPAQIDVNYDNKTSATDQFKVGVSFSSQDEDSEYDLMQIPHGAIELQLFEGEGITGNPIGGLVRITEQSELEKFLTEDGYEITPTTFGSVTLKGDKRYTIYLSSIADLTYEVDDITTADDTRNRSYTNYFTKINVDTYIISPEETAPDLPDNPAGAIESEPITKAQAADYGVAQYYNDPEMSSDTIIGYKINTTYNNYAKKARKLNYYLLEYNSFFDALRADKDPIGNYLGAQPSNGIPKVWEESFAIDAEEGTLPEVAVFFGDKPSDWPEYDPKESWKTYPKHNGCIVYFAGDVTTQTQDEKTYMKGMDRGYRYTAAYTMEVLLKEHDTGMQLYPYCMESYPEKASNIGIGQIKYTDAEGRTMYTSNQFAGVAYILNAGLLPAPKQEPNFQTILQASKTTLEKSAGGVFEPENVANGTALLEYYYSDYDDVLIAPNNKIHSSKLVNGTAGSDGKKSVELGNSGEWGNEVSFNVVSHKGRDGDYIDDVTVDRHLFNLDYSTMLSQYGIDLDILTTEFGTVISQWDYKSYFEGDGQGGKGIIERADADLLWNGKPRYEWTVNDEQSYIDIKEYIPSGQIANPIHEIWEKAFALKLDIHTDKGSGMDRTVYLSPRVENKRYFARLDTNSISDMLGGGAKMTINVTLMYDSGAMGWEMTDANTSDLPTRMYGLQFLGETGGTYKLGNYIVNDYATAQPGGALYVGKATSPLDSIYATGGSQKREVYSFTNKTNNRDYKRNIYSFVHGVDVSTTTVVKPSGTDYLMPKEIGTINFDCKEGGGVPVSFIIPTITFDPDKCSVSGEAITLNDFTIQNIDQATPSTIEDPATGKQLYKVQAMLYHSTDTETMTLQMARKLPIDDKFRVDKSVNDEANGIIDFLVRDDGTIYGYYDTNGHLCVRVSEDGGKTYIYKDPDGNRTEGPTFSHLTSSDNQYYLNFRMTFDQAGSTEPVDRILIDKNYLQKGYNDPVAAYLFETAKEVTINIAGAYYPEMPGTEAGSMADYFLKRLDVDFNINRTKDLDIHFEIYYQKVDADMDDETWKGINIYHGEVEDPAVINFNNSPASMLVPAFSLMRNNVVPITLSPWKMNELQIPGLPEGTYWLRVTATEKSGAVAGHAVKEFTVPSANDYGVLATLADRKQDSLEFWVSTNDDTDTFMGYHYDSSQGLTPQIPEEYCDTGLYAVRFTKTRIETATASDGTVTTTRYNDRISTIYDDKLYPFNTIKQSFVLDSTTAPGFTLEPDTEYSINVYAVWDYTNSGNIKYMKDGVETTVSPTWKDIADPNNIGWNAYFGDVTYTKEGAEAILAGQNFNNYINSFWESSSQPGSGVYRDNPAKAAEEGRFLIYTADRKTAGVDGIIVGTDTYKAQSAKKVQLRLAEAYGLVTFKEGTKEIQFQNCDSIIWSIQNITGKQETKTLTAESDSDKMFKWDEENAVYTLDMNLSKLSINSGEQYFITVKLIKGTDEYTISNSPILVIN